MAVFLVIISGCNQPSLGVSDGVRINSFGFDPQTISDKDQAELSIALENVGAFDATDVNFFIYGYDMNVWESVSTDASIGTASADSWTIDNFEGYVMDTGQPGFSADYTQILKVMEGKIAKGITQSYSFYGRLCYDYETRAVAKVSAISLSQRRDEKSKGTFSSGGIFVKNSFAPVQIEVKTKSPIVFYTANEVPETEVVLIIKNAGGGYPAATGCSQDVTVADVNKLSGLEVSLDGAVQECDTSYSFYDGQAIVYCNLTLDSSDKPKGEYTLSVTATYYYYNDVRASISVVGSSDSVEVTPPSGGPVAGKIYKGGYCEDLCKADTNTLARLRGKALAVCTDGDIATYPGTDVVVRLTPQSSGSGLVGSSEVYLENLKMHDVSVADINLGGLGLDVLDKPGISKQYTDKTFYYDSDGDGLPNEWEKLVGLLPDKRDSDDDGKSDGSELCPDAGKCCDITKTYKANYDTKTCKYNDYLDKLTLGIGKAGLSDTLSSKNPEVTTTANPSPHLMNSDELVDGMKIVEIDGKTIESITSSNENSKIKAIKYIDVSMLNLKKMGVNINTLFYDTKCSNLATYDKYIVCKCIAEVETLSGGNAGFPALESSTTSECNTKCSNEGQLGGRCITTDVKNTFSDPIKAKRCSGSQLVSYSLAADTKYGCSDICHCYKLLSSLNPTEKMLMCA